MISVVMNIPVSRQNKENLDRLNEVYKWLGENVVDHWSVNRLTMDAIKVDMWGLDEEQDMVAFKLKFKL